MTRSHAGLKRERKPSNDGVLLIWLLAVIPFVMLAILLFAWQNNFTIVSSAFQAISLVLLCFLSGSVWSLIQRSEKERSETLQHRRDSLAMLQMTEKGVAAIARAHADMRVQAQQINTAVEKVPQATAEQVESVVNKLPLAVGAAVVNAQQEEASNILKQSSDELRIVEEK